MTRALVVATALLCLWGCKCKSSETAEAGAPAPDAAVAALDAGGKPDAGATRDAGSAPDASVTLGVIDYQPRHEAFKPLSWTYKTVENPPPDCDGELGDVHVCGETLGRGASFFTAGRFTAGPYDGGELIVEVDQSAVEGPGKGTSEEHRRQRLVRLGKRLVLLARNSDSTQWDRAGEVARSFAKQGYQLEVDPDLDVAPLRMPKRLEGPKPLQVLDLDSVDDDPLENGDKVFTDEAVGDVYSEGANLRFTVNSPDGTALHYVESLTEGDVIDWSDGGSERSERYSFQKSENVVSGRDVTFPFDTIVDVDAGALMPAGTRYGGVEVFEYRDEQHPDLKNIYESYLSFVQTMRGEKPRSYESFIGSHPVFFQRDGFGRTIRFIHTDFLRVDMAEPIVYLYPQRRERVTVRVGAPVTLTRTVPAYRAGFVVDAAPNGSLWPVGERRSYRSLFWEGLSAPLPLAREGFVVKRDELPGFWRRTLPTLGLRGEEIDDFVNAWTPRLRHAPWYQISFVPRGKLDALAPLEVSPPPDTMIRLLMDAVPLQQPLTLAPQHFGPAPVRHGFTVVEWGGIQR